MITAREDSLQVADTAAAGADTVDTVDSVPAAALKGVVLANPEPLHPVRGHVSPVQANSWIIMCLLGLFVAVCFKFRNNFKYFRHLLKDLTDVRERGNVFDDTVRETSFMTLLNMLCIVSSGVLIYVGLSREGAVPAMPSLAGNACCIAAAALYGIVMPGVYMGVGDIFTDRTHGRLWMQGFVASQGVLGLALFPLALVAMFYPGGGGWILPTAIVVVLIAKILFITKGFRIFFTRYSSWITFLYYLCSLEIVPLVLTIAAAGWLCAKVV